MNKHIRSLTFLVAALIVLPVLYILCFHFGWGNPFHSVRWIIGCYIAALVYAVAQAVALHFLPSKNRKTIAALTLAYYLWMFTLSCTAIIFGWDMHPKSWTVIVVCYALAAFLPPFSEVSQQLFFWKEHSEEASDQIDVLTRERNVLQVKYETLRRAFEDASKDVFAKDASKDVFAKDARKRMSAAMSFVDSLEK